MTPEIQPSKVKMRLRKKLAIRPVKSTASGGSSTQKKYRSAFISAGRNLRSPYLRRNPRTSAIPESCFSNNFAGLFIFAQTKKNRRAQFSIAGPFGEFDFANENRIYPMHFAHHGRRDSLHPLSILLRWQINKWTITAFFGPEFLVQYG